MPFVDRIIQFMQTQAGERVILESDHECKLYRAGGSSATIPQRFTRAQIGSVLGEIMSEEQRRRFTSGESFSFAYDGAGGATEVEVAQDPASVTICIRPRATASANG